MSLCHGDYTSFFMFWEVSLWCSERKLKCLDVMLWAKEWKGRSLLMMKDLRVVMTTHGQEQPNCVEPKSSADSKNHDIDPNKFIRIPKSRTWNNSLKPKKIPGDDAFSHLLLEPMHSSNYHYTTGRQRKAPATQHVQGRNIALLFRLTSCIKGTNMEWGGNVVPT